ncbi:MAG: MASE1 domain-containing protein [Bacteriovoracaceae bacterium]|nr:MASE1 domain-containing protein [Bacteriovoracaceae bacterium]
MKLFLENLMLALTYFVIAKFCQLFAIEPGNVTPIWASSGICFIWVYIRGYSLLPGVFIGAFLGNVTAYIYPILPEKLLFGSLAGLFNGSGDSLGIFLGVMLLKKINGNLPVLSSLKSTLTFIFASAIGGSFISAIFGVSGLAMFNILPWEAYSNTFITWLIGDTIGILILVPILENIFVQKKHKQIKISKRLLLELVTGFIFITLVSFFTFNMGEHAHFAKFTVPTLIILPLLTISTFRFDELFMNFVIFYLSSLILGLTIYHIKDFNSSELNFALISSQLFIFSVSSTLLLIISAINRLHFLNKRMINQDRLSTLGQVSASMAHEVMTPLTVIQFSSDIISRQLKEDPSISEPIKKIERSINIISRLVKSLKKYSYHRDTIKKTHTDINNILNEALSLTEMRSRKIGINITRNGFSNIDLLCDEIKSLQVFVNIINNAIDAVERTTDPWINFSTEVNETESKFIVTNSGLAISDEQAEKIFAPFYTTKDETKGTGLGLSISRGIMLEQSGNLSYANNEGHTSFVISFSKIDAQETESVIQ